MSATDLRARVLAAAQRDASPPRAVVAAAELRRIAVALVVTLGVFAAVDGVRIGGRPLSLVLVTALGAAAMTALAGVVALTRGRSMLGRSRALLWTIVVATPLVLLAWKLTWTFRFDALGPTRLGLKCLALSLTMSVTPMAVLLAARGGSDPLHPAATGSAIGAAVGAMAWLLVDLWCPVGYVAHLLLGHVLPMIIVIVAGAALGRRYIMIRKVG